MRIFGNPVEVTTPELSINDPTVTEGNSGATTMTFIVTPSAAPEAQETVSYSIAGTATDGTDYTVGGATGTLTFSAGSDDAETIVVTVIGDEVYEEDQTVEVKLTGPSGGITLGADPVGTGTITNDDMPPLLEIAPLRVDEGDTGDTAVMSFVITKSGATDLPVTVAYAITGTATESGNGADFMHTVASPVNIPADRSSATIEIDIIEDNLAEPDETVIVTLSGHDNHRFAGDASTLVATGTIINDDPLEFSVSDASATEGNSGTASMTFTVMLGAETPSPVSVLYAVEDDSAMAPGDYTDPPDTRLTFQPGNPLTQTFDVVIVGDTLPEGDETFTVELSDPVCTSCPAGVEPSLNSGASTAKGTINDDDGPIVSISSPSVAEGGSRDSPTLDFEVRLSSAWSQDVTVGYSVTGGTATSGADFQMRSAGSLTFVSSRNEVSKMVQIRVTGDDVYEAAETVVITLDGLSGGAFFTDGATSITGEGTITNDDRPPLLTITSSREDEGDSGDTATLSFEIAKSGETALPVTVEYAITGTATASGNGADFSHTVSSPITINPADSSATIEVDIIEDNLAEPDETVTVTLSGHDNHRFVDDEATLASTGTIVNDDFLTLSINSPSVSEGGASDMPTLAFEVTLGAVSSAVVTVDYAITDGTATAGTDYATPAGSTLMIAAGQTIGSIPVTVIGDADAEPSETIVMTISNPLGGAASEPSPTIEVAAGTGTIVTDDGSVVSIDSPRVEEGDSGTTDLVFTVSISPASSGEISVRYSIAATESTATAGEDFRPPDPNTDTLTFAANSESPQTITVVVIGDSEAEPDETVVVVLSGVTGDGVIGVDTGTGTILGDDFGLAISGPESSVTEPSGAMTRNLDFTVTLTPESLSEVTVRYSFGGIAVKGADFTDTTVDSENGMLTFAPGETRKIIRAQVNSDFVDEDSETVTVSLSGEAGAFIRTGMESAEGVIEPAEAAGSVAVLSVESPQIAAGGGSGPPVVEFSLNLSREQSGVAGAVSVEWFLLEVTRTAAGSGVEAVTQARGVTGRDVMARELATGNATVQAGNSAVEVEGDLNAGVTFDSFRGSQLVLELERPSVAGVLVEQSDRVPVDIQVAAHSGDRVAVAVFTTSSERQQSKQLSYVLSGVGRSAASSLVSIVWDRVSSRRSGNAAAARLGGRGLDPEALASDGTRGAVREVAGLFGIEAVSPDLSPDAGYVSGGIDYFREWAGLQDGRKFVANTELALPLGASGSGGFAIWGKGGLSSFEGEVEADDAPAFSYDGQATSLHIGFDMPLGATTLFGLALTTAQGEVDHAFSGEDQSDGSVETSLTSVSPWLHWSTSGGGDFWAAISVGSGTAETVEESAESVERDLDLQVIAIGMRGFNRDVGRRQMAVKADIFTADAEASAIDQAEAVSGSSNRLRVAAESVSDRRMRGGSAVSTRLEGGGRYDGGDDDSGFGADALISVEFISSNGRFSAAGKGGLIVFHTKGGFSETHFGGMLAYRRAASGRGLQLSLRPEWNASAANSTGGLWDAPSAGVGNASDQDARMKARLGWGVGALNGRTLATLYSETEEVDDGRSLRIGAELAPMDAAFGTFRFGVFGEQEADTASGQDRSIMLEGRLGL